MAKRGVPEDGYQPEAAVPAVVDVKAFDEAVAVAVAVVEDASFRLGNAKSLLKVAADEDRRDEALALVEHWTGEVRRGIAAEARARAARARAKGLRPF